MYAQEVLCDTRERRDIVRAKFTTYLQADAAGSAITSFSWL